MRFIQGLVPAFLLLAAGCFGSPTPGDDAPQIGTEGPLYFENGVPEEERGQDEYWLILLTGTERVEHKDGDGGDRVIECGASSDFLYRIDPARERLVYDADAADLHDGNFTFVVITDVTGTDFASESYGTGCPIERTIDGLSGYAKVSFDVPRFGAVELTIYPQGVIQLPDGSPVPLGWGAGFNYTRTASTTANEYWVFGEWRAENLGAWPKDQIVAQ